MHRRHFIGGLVCIIAGLISMNGWGAEFDGQKLATLREKMQQYVDQKLIPGAVAVVGSKDGIASLEAVGTLKVGDATPMPKDATFRIASMTKPITAIGIMMLAEEGKLSVDDPVEKHLPEFKGQQLVVSREGGKTVLGKPARLVTIRDLLTHTSGLPSGLPANHADLYFKRDLTLQQAIDLSAKLPLDFAPGSKWSYCNAGIDTLGRIIEVASGQSYETFLAKRVFEPLGMKDTTFYPSDEQLQRLAGLYDQKEGELKFIEYSLLGPTRNAKHPIPAGGLYSTGADLAMLYQLMLQGGAIGQTRVLSAASIAEMTKIQTGDLVCGFTPGMSFGYGWAVIGKPQGVHEMLSVGTYGHGGVFGTQGWVDPQQDLFVILLIQRIGLPNADATDMRRDLQTIAVSALTK